ncbi:aspartyl/asparaginyl beta-hydroxylase-like isoform X7 [Pollicipes pollicipes]|uniref:aspartyl/asparaginyl beta-hydroxylase-like isoform X7 n=1 Tax=Pollicipes pollicipes TaxID=41117 RepID=UPI0018855685|nr:aspartyl/asparaginyl beta-hydroxylase-like isoform X7 [Pollicipes pollicipes]
MSGETQARRRKDKKKKRGRGEAPGASGDEPWQETFHATTHDDDKFYVEPDSVSDDGTGEEDVKEHSEGGSGCLTVIVFLVLLAGVGVLLGLIYVQTQGIRHVEAPAPAAQFAPVVEKVQEAVPPPPADATGDEQPAGQQPQEGAAGSPEEVKQVVYVEAPEPGIQLEGSEPVISEQFVRADAAVEQLQDAPAAGGDPNVVLEERRVRVRQVLRQITDPDGTVREEVVSEEVIEEIEDEAAASDSGTAAAGEAAGSADVTADTPEPAVAAAGVTEPESVTAEAAAPLEGADDLVVEVEDEEAAPPTAAPEEPEPAEASYDKADITGADDWEVRGELDAADALLQTDAAAGLNAFGAILSRRPRSPRALWGRARALNAQAQQERSNNVLDKAISAFKAVLDLDVEKPLPLALFRQVAETCVQQMRFRGQMDQAARIQQRLIQKFPDDYMLRNHLATVFLTYGQEAAAEEVLQEVLRLWPNNGYAKVHLGFVRRQQGRHEEAALLMQQGLDTNEPGVHDKRFYHNLGDSYHRIGQLEKARETYEEGVRRGLLLSAVQRSLYNVDRLTARPYWTAEQTGSAELISELEAHWETIRAEMLSLLSSDRPEDGFQPEQEQLSKSGDWKQFTLFRRGRRDQYACAKAPKTCALVQRFPEAAGCRRGQVKFSMLAPGTRVWPHTGPTNCRLRCHLGLQVPPGAGITVAGQNRTWEEGKVLIIDDSFEHEVWNDGERTRYILIVDIWHPELTEEERRTLPTI